MTTSLAPYMTWAKSRPHAPVDLALSNVLACEASEIDGLSAALDFTGQNENGFPPLLEAIGARYGVSPDRIATAIGTSGANFLVGLALIERGRDVLVETPAYDPLLGIARALGANVVRFERRFEDQFAIDPETVRRTLTPSTRLVVLTQPHNPSSGVSTDDAIAEVARDAARVGAHVLVDEVYLDAARRCGARPAALLAENIISTNSLTKSYGLAPLRCGWAIASSETAERIRRARDVVDGTGSIPAERMSVLALSQLDRLSARADRLIAPNVTHFREWLAATPQLEGFVQRGTVAFPRLRSGRDARDFAETLLCEYQTAVVPGHFFEAPAHMRIGLGIEPEVLRRGLQNIRRALERG
jgi:aspartate/methionine/tyrosine aminotransferase